MKTWMIMGSRYFTSEWIRVIIITERLGRARAVGRREGWYGWNLTLSTGIGRSWAKPERGLGRNRLMRCCCWVGTSEAMVRDRITSRKGPRRHGITSRTGVGSNPRCTVTEGINILCSERRSRPFLHLLDGGPRVQSVIQSSKITLDCGKSGNEANKGHSGEEDSAGRVSN